MLAGDLKPLVNYDKLGPEAMLPIPRPDHYLPLLLAARQQGENMTFPVEGVDGGSVSMLSVRCRLRIKTDDAGHLPGILRNFAFTATITVLSDINMAPIAGVRSIP